MRRGFLQVCLSLGALSFTTMTVDAQQIVHAVAGKITAISQTTRIIVFSTDDNPQGLYDILTKNVPLDFEKNVKALTTPAESFTKANCEAVVFYFGDDNDRTSVAVEDLGPGPLVKTSGTVVKLDKHAHVLTIKNDAGQEQTFQIDAKTIADSMLGVVEGQKFDPGKGEKVRITATTENGAATALFIRALSL